MRVAARMGLVRRTALPPSPVIIGLEKAAVGSPQYQAHDRTALCHRQLNGYSCSMVDLSAD